MPTQAYSCGRCEKAWTGLTAAHCGKCHHTFTGITAFDLHRVGSPGLTRLCCEPDLVKDQHGKPRLVPVTKTHWLGWGEPGSEEQWWE